MRTLSEQVDQIFGPSSHAQLAAKQYVKEARISYEKNKDADTPQSRFDIRAEDLAHSYPGLARTVDAVSEFVHDDTILSPSVRHGVGRAALEFLAINERVGHISDHLPK